VQAEDARQQREASLIRITVHETKILPTFVNHPNRTSILLFKMEPEAPCVFAEAPFCEAVAEEDKLG